MCCRNIYAVLFMLLSSCLLNEVSVAAISSIGGVPVLIGPDTGAPPSFDGSSFITNQSQQNGDLLALQYRQNIEQTAMQKGGDVPDYYLVFSGSLGGQAYNEKPYTGNNISDVNLYSTNISLLAAASSWATGYISIAYDNSSPTALNYPAIGIRASNARLYVDQGFITIGNLNKTGWYTTIGQQYIPFGQFNGYGTDSPVTASLFTIEERPLILGYSYKNDANELDVAAYTYQGESNFQKNSNVRVQADIINEWGLSLNYSLTKTTWNATLGGGYVSNVSDSGAMQSNGGPATGEIVAGDSIFPNFCAVFGGFAYPCGFRGNSVDYATTDYTELLVHRVPGLDVYVSFTAGPYNIVSEFITATEPFSPLNMQFGPYVPAGAGPSKLKPAKPQAFDLEASYSFNLYDKPSNFAIGYGATRQALALLVPARTYSATVATSFWKNTKETLGYEYTANYASWLAATGQGKDVYLPMGGRLQLGRKTNTVLFSITTSF